MAIINEREQKKDAAYTCSGPDRIHPGNAGYLVMAYLFLKDQRLAGVRVADFTLNAHKTKAEASENCQIGDIKSSADILSFNYLVKSLPFPFDTVARAWVNKQVETEALQVIPFMPELNNEQMKIKGLRGNAYLLKIDGIPIARMSALQLKEGINLASLHNTPQYQQALQIIDLNSKRKEIESKFRNY